MNNLEKTHNINRRSFVQRGTAFLAALFAIPFRNKAATNSRETRPIVSPAYLGEIRVSPYTFAPQGWAFCEGQLMSVSTNPLLFQLLGTKFGGNGSTTFALPDLRGRIPFGIGAFSEIGTEGGVEKVTLSKAQLPKYDIVTNKIAVRGNLTGIGLVTGGVTPTNITFGGTDSPTAVNNIPPYIALNYIIALTGTYPSV